MNNLKEKMKQLSEGRSSAPQEEDKSSVRSRKIVRTSVVCIAANVLLAAFKAAVGLTSHSIAVVMDAVNNLSDAASSVITIVGAKLAGKEPDKKHPFGYGRVEYLSAMLISLLVLYAGVTAFTESVRKIIAPDTPDYSGVSLVIVAVAVVVKIVLGKYVKGVGKEIGSDSLVNSGEDALMDSVVSFSTLVAAAVYLLFHVSLEAWLGAIIALVIIRSGVEMLRETLSKVLGERVDADLARAIKKTVSAFAEVHGVYDLVVHNYGPDSYNASVHIEVPDTLTADQIDQLTRDVTMSVYQKHDVILTAVGVYSMNTRDPDMQMHGFYIDREEKTVRFDVVISFDAEDRNAVLRQVCGEVQKAFPDYALQIALDTDFS